MPIKAIDNQAATGNHLIPEHPFIMCINGSIASGKSTVANDLILNKLKGKYHRGVVISPTIRLDAKMQSIVACEDLCKSNQALHDAIHSELSILDEEDYQREILPPFHGVDKDDCHTSYNPKIIQDIINKQEYIIENYGKDLSDKVLIFVDDAPAVGVLKKSHADIFAKFCTTVRHYNCSLIFATQMFKCVPKLIRHQVTCGVFFACNDVEQKEIWESFSINMPWHKWAEYFAILTEKPYSHITINLKNSKGHKMIKGFEEFIA